MPKKGAACLNLFQTEKFYFLPNIFFLALLYSFSIITPFLYADSRSISSCPKRDQNNHRQDSQSSHSFFLCSLKLMPTARPPSLFKEMGIFFECDSRRNAPRSVVASKLHKLDSEGRLFSNLKLPTDSGCRFVYGFLKFDRGLLAHL